MAKAELCVFHRRLESRCRPVLCVRIDAVVCASKYFIIGRLCLKSKLQFITIGCVGSSYIFFIYY